MRWPKHCQIVAGYLAPRGKVKWGSLEYTSIVSLPAQADTGTMWIHSFLGGSEVPLETFNQSNKNFLCTSKYLHTLAYTYAKLEKSLPVLGPSEWYNQIKNVLSYE